MNRKKFFIILFILSLFLFVKAQDDFLGDQFVAEPEISTRILYEKGMIVFTIEVPVDHHITDLKNNFFKIKVEKNDYVKVKKVNFPTGVAYADEMVFKDKVEVKVKIISSRDITSPINLKFTVGYQICQEKPREMCFAPDSQDIIVPIEKSFVQTNNEVNSNTDWIPSIERTSTTQGKKPEKESFFKKIERLLTEELEKQSVLLFLLVFALGFLTSLTPCVYPVIPIIMGYIGSQAKGSKLKGFYLSVFFVLGLGLVYSMLGVLAAASGSMIGASFQNPVVVVIIAGIFILMGLSLAGLFEIPVPTSISSKVQAGGYKSQVIGSLIIGGVAGIIAAPCAGPVLIAILSWISQTRDLLMGFLIMFVFSLGMGVIFILVGTFTGIISSLPKGGKWMDYMKYLFSILLIVGGIYFLSSISSKWVTLLMWGIFLISISIFIGLFKVIDKHDHKEKFYKIIVVLIFLCGAFLFFKSIEIKYFPYTVGSIKSYENDLTWIGDLEHGKLKAEKENKILMVDAYAEWCVACKELDKYTFSDQDVSKILKNYVLVKLDFTKKSEKNRELRKKLNIIGMPTILFFNIQGREIKRFSGFKNKNEFLEILNNL